MDEEPLDPVDPVDPVCGMIVDRDEAPDSVAYEGQTYYFCSQACREAFEKEPSRYAE